MPGMSEPNCVCIRPAQCSRSRCVRNTHPHSTDTYWLLVHVHVNAHQCAYRHKSTHTHTCAYGVCTYTWKHTKHTAIETIKLHMAGVKHKILILSGKGGVGKSTFTAHLAHGLAADENKQVSYLCVSICM